MFITVYDTSVNMNVVILNTIHIDIMDYILPATCTDTEFRQMWQDFEWENKVINIFIYINFVTDVHFYYLIFIGYSKYYFYRFT